MKRYYYRKTEAGRDAYSIRRRDPEHPNGYVHLHFEYSPQDARRTVSLLNKSDKENC